MDHVSMLTLQRLTDQHEVGYLLEHARVTHQQLITIYSASALHTLVVDARLVIVETVSQSN